MVFQEFCLRQPWARLREEMTSVADKLWIDKFGVSIKILKIGSQYNVHII